MPDPHGRFGFSHPDNSPPSLKSPPFLLFPSGLVSVPAPPSVPDDCVVSNARVRGLSLVRADADVADADVVFVDRGEDDGTAVVAGALWR